MGICYDKTKYLNQMTQANEPNDFPREIDRQFRHLNRRVEGLEETQITTQELARAFDRVYDDTNAIRRDLRDLDQKVDRRFDELNGKIDIIMRHITGQNNS
jgi:translation initiation factor 2B subunit (eIF-2B alpha/beta/delta family)